MTVSQYSLTNSPNQTLKITVPGDTNTLSLVVTLSYNAMAGYWVMGIYDVATRDPIIVGIPFLPGHDLMGQYQYLNIGSIYVYNIGDSTISIPNDTNIAGNFVLVWVI